MPGKVGTDSQRREVTGTVGAADQKISFLIPSPCKLINSSGARREKWASIGCRKFLSCYNIKLVIALSERHLV
jgi:hypothetical protein